jgi:hypothetical protein
MDWSNQPCCSAKRGFLEQNGFQKNMVDICVMNEIAEDSRHILLIIYIDTILDLVNSEKHQSWVKKTLKEKYKKVNMETFSTICLKG